jgi:hypothetical protein
MSRQQHDMANDHFPDISALAEQIADGTATSGYVPTSNGPGVAATWAASSGGGGGLAELITGNSQNFGSSLGSWTNSGGTLTRDTSYKMAGQTASAKFAVTTSGQYAEVPISGTFLAGVDYWLVLWISNESTSSTYALDMIFGLIGTDSVTESISLNMISGQPYVGNGSFVAFGLHWQPSANRTGVKARVSIPITNTTTWHVGMARSWQTPLIGPIFVGDRSYLPHNFGGTNRMHLAPWANGSGGFNAVPDGGVWMYNSASTSGLDAYGPQVPLISMFSEHTPGSLAKGGVEIEVGADYVGLYISEKDSSTIQIYDDASGAYNIELRDQGSFGFKTADGTHTSALSLLHHILVGTADPTAGGGVAHPQPALYLRDNSGTTELWTTTGTGATAWQKVTIP